MILEREQTTQRPLSLHIPRIDTRNLGRQYRDPAFVQQFITAQFRHSRIGTIHHVDLLSKKNRQGYLYYEAFVHFTAWCDNAFSLALRRKACSPRLQARLPLRNNTHYWIVNENLHAPLLEDWQSLLAAIPAARWMQAADEEELCQYLHAEAQNKVMDRWYKTPPTDEQLAATARIERCWSASRSAPRLPIPRSESWTCDQCHNPAVAGDPASEAYSGNVCARCYRDRGTGIPTPFTRPWDTP